MVKLLIMRMSIRLFADKIFGKNSPICIGRWNIDYDTVIQERKVYLTNMDHCGCCGNITTKAFPNKKSLNTNLATTRLPKKTQHLSGNKYFK
jgi:hypothetical protein